MILVEIMNKLVRNNENIELKIMKLLALLKL